MWGAGPSSFVSKPFPARAAYVRLVIPGAPRVPLEAVGRVLLVPGKMEELAELLKVSQKNTTFRSA